MYYDISASMGALFRTLRWPARGYVIQIFCHELGCLPVSKLCGIPTVADLFEVDGSPKDPEERMLKQLPALLDQLEWWQ